MSGYQSVFRRVEVKFLLSAAQYRALVPVLEQYMVPDDFFKSTISNLYYDTPDFQLVRTSLAKPAYKEKLRLRCYRVPSEDSQSFMEIKKKVDGVVYKRRADLPYGRALAYLAGEGPGGDSQIFRELDWFLRFYKGLSPAIFLSYNRVSLRGREDKNLRMTFDRDILWRADHLDLAEGAWGQDLLQPGERLLEIKISNTMPLWLADALSELGIFPTGFSKYGAAYQTLLRQQLTELRMKRYA